MTTQSMTRRGGGGNYVQRSSSSGLYDVLELILDKGLVIDIFVRVSLVGIEILTIDARIVIASVDTYLRFAEAVNRLDLQETELSGLPELQEKGAEAVAEHKVEDVKEEVPGLGKDTSIGDAAKGVAAGAAIAGAAAAAKKLAERRSGRRSDDKADEADE